MPKKSKISARISPYNDDMIKALADTLFYEERKNEGNYSQALDWILTNFRLYTKYKDLVKFLEYHAAYERGVRTKETIDAMKNLLIFLESVDRLTK